MAKSAVLAVTIALVSVAGCGRTPPFIPNGNGGDAGSTLPTVACSVAAQSVAESVGSVTIAVSLSEASVDTVTVPYSVTGTAANPGDHDLAASGTITIAAGQTSANLTFNVVNDTGDEPDETVVVTLGTPTNAMPGAITVHTVTITDDDATPTVAFTASSQNSAEWAGTITIAASLSAASGQSVTVPYGVTGTATYPTDHNLTSGTLTFAAGATTANITFALLNDNLDEVDKTVIVTMATPTDATLGATTVHTVTITDEDAPPTVAFTTSAQTVSEAVGTVTITASLSVASALAVTVPYTLTGTAAAPGDHSLTNGTLAIAAGSTSANITFTVVNDTLDEPDETVVVTLGTPANSMLGLTTVHTVTINDDDATPTVAWSAAAQTVAEGVGTVTLTASLNAVSAQMVTVPYTVTGTAANPADHSLANGVLTIAAGQTSADVTLTVVNDLLDELDETVIVTMGTPTNATAGATTVHTVTISDDDATPTFSFTAASQSVSESIGTVTILGNLSAESGQTVTIPYTVTGTAANPADHNLASGTLTLTPGTTSANIIFNVTNDSADELGETVIVTLGTPANAALGATTAHTVTLTDDDAVPVVQWTALAQSVAESIGTVTVTASLSAPSWQAVTVSYSVSGTATNPADHNLASGSFTINPGLTTGTVTFNVVNDGVIESAETVIVTMTSATNATLGATTVHTVTIVDGAGTVAEVRAGGEHTCARLLNGKVRCWGRNNYGQLGYGNTNDIGDTELPSTAGDVSVGGDVVQIALGYSHTCALLSTGKVRCWGRDNFGQLGYGSPENNIGDDELPSSAGDVDVGGIVIQITAGGEHTCALLSTRKVRCWGYGLYGRLGYGNTNIIGDDEAPWTAGDVSVGGDVVQIAAGWYHTCALLATGRVRCWGAGADGRLGYGNQNDIGDNELPSSAGDVSVGGDVAQITAGNNYTCAVLSTGKARCWGNGGDGRLGYGNTNSTAGGLPSTAGDIAVGADVVQIVAGGNHTCALLATGKVRCWGKSWAMFSYGGQLGYGNTVSIGDDELPTAAGDVEVGGTVVQISVGSVHTCALLSTGKVRCWGWGGEGRLGLGIGCCFGIGDDELPITAGDVSIGGPPGVRQVAAGDSHTCAVLSSGKVRCWGLAASGQLGYGNTQSIGDDAGETPSTAGDVSVGGDAIQVATGGNHTCAILSTGRVRCWGLGASGQLGYGAATNIGDDAGSVPSDAGDVSIYADSGVTEIGAGANHTCALIATGNVRCWGLGASGQLGYGNTENIGDDAGELPSTVGDVNVGATVSQIAVGANHTCAVTSTGTVRCWGEGAFGKLGYASTTSVGDLVVPASAGDVGVGGLVVQVAAGANHTCALTATGNVRCWGSAAYGQLGYGNTIAIGDTETPSTAGDVSVFPDGGIVQLAAGANHTCALHATGNLRCWGRNNVGQLGYAHTNDIGDDAGEYPSTAGDVGLDGGAIRITAGASHTCAILASGQLRCWGQGASGRLGYGATTDIGDDEFPFAAGDVSVQ